MSDSESSEALASFLEGEAGDIDESDVTHERLVAELLKSGKNEADSIIRSRTHNPTASATFGAMVVTLEKPLFGQATHKDVTNLLSTWRGLRRYEGIAEDGLARTEFVNALGGLSGAQEEERGQAFARSFLERAIGGAGSK